MSTVHGPGVGQQFLVGGRGDSRVHGAGEGQVNSPWCSGERRMTNPCWKNVPLNIPPQQNDRSL